jgi:sugar phosphate permease
MPARDKPSVLAVVAPFCLGYYVSYLLRTVNAVIAPDLVRELGIGAADLGLLTSTYFLAFAVAQLPVGVALDRFGARRVVATLLAVASIGVVVFATGHAFVRLAVGRGLIGLGVSACLMGAFKAFGAIFPRDRQASLTGLVMSAGAIGALSASLPVEWALPIIGWRQTLLVVAVFSAAAAALIAVAGRDGSGLRVQNQQEDQQANGRDGRQASAHEVAALLSVLKARAFWRFAPQAALFTGGFMAVQSLWAVPWVMTVDGRTRGQAAALLLVLNAGMLLGQLAIVFGAGSLARRRIHRERFMAGSVTLALLVEGLLIAGLVSGPIAWFAFGCFSAAGAQVYGVTSGYFPESMSGRVSTAVNLLAFVGAFCIQWGIGLAVDRLAASAVSPAAALRMTFAGLWIAQTVAVAWGFWSSSAGQGIVGRRDL